MFFDIVNEERFLVIRLFSDIHFDARDLCLEIMASYVLASLSNQSYLEGMRSKTLRVGHKSSRNPRKSIYCHT